MSRKVNLLLALACVTLFSAAQPLLAGEEAQPVANSAKDGCKLTAETIAELVKPVTPAEPEVDMNLLQPKPIFRAFVGDCCPPGGASQCPGDRTHYLIHCGSPQCESGGFSCLYTPK